MKNVIPSELIRARSAVLPALDSDLGPRHYLLAAWLGLRLIPLALGIYFFPDVMTWLGTLAAIHLIGSLPERLVFLLLLTVLLGGGFKLAGRIAVREPIVASEAPGVEPLGGGPAEASTPSPAVKLARRLLLLAFAFTLFWLLCRYLTDLQPVAGALFLTAILALNLIPTGWLAGRLASQPTNWLADLFIIGLLGLAELLLLKTFICWLFLRWLNREVSLNPIFRRWLGRLPVALMVPAVAALLLSPYRLAELHRLLFPNPAVERFSQGNFNGLELDVEQQRLYASGYGFNHLQLYQLDALDRPPRQSPVETAYAQGFGYNPLDQELYVYHQDNQHLLVLDAATLELKKTIETPQLSPGDAWVVWDKFTGNLLIASEADELKGIPMVVINPKTGYLIDTLEIAPGFILPHPTRPLFFMTVSFFQERNDLIVYNSELHQIVNETPVAENLDRLALTVYHDELELLAPSALDATVLRLDPETLEHKGQINSLFGARAIAVDPVHNLLLSGSLVSHWLELIDLNSQQRLARFYVGPWLRGISLDSQAGVAYISSHEGLFKINYLNPLGVDYD
jgi:hypothetical protein